MSTRGRPPGAKAIPWDSIVARLREHPDRWMLLSEMAHVSDRTIQVIRKRERRALRIDDGVIRCRRKATAWLPDGTVRCTLFLKFEPKKEKQDGNPPLEDQQSQGGVVHPG